MKNVRETTSPTTLEILNEAIAKKVTLRELSLLYTRHVLATLSGNKVHASRYLGVDRRTIQRWAKGELPAPRKPGPKDDLQLHLDEAMG